MEEALSNHVVLATIAKFLPYQDLKTARLVNRQWAKSIKLVFKKRSIYKIGDIFGWANCKPLRFAQSEAHNPDLAANVTWHLPVRKSSRRSFYKAVTGNEPWLAYISQLEFDAGNTSQLNRFLPFLLDQLPCLEELCLYSIDFTEQDQAEMPAEIASINVTEARKKSQVKRISLGGYCDAPPARFGASLDPRFLKQCAQLKDFHINIGYYEATMLDFLVSWKKMEPQFQLLESVSIRMPNRWWPLQGFSKDMCKLLVDFVHWTRPKSLKLLGLEFLEFASMEESQGPGRVMGRSNQWTSSAVLWKKSRVQSLTASFPVSVHANTQQVACPHWMVVKLKQCAAFSNVSKLTLKAGQRVYNTQWINDSSSSVSAAAHDFEKVTTLTIVEGIFSCYAQQCCSWLEATVGHFANLTSLSIATIALGKSDTFDQVCDILAQVLALSELKIRVDFAENTAARVEKIQQGHLKGYFQKLGVLKGLTKMEIKMPLPEIPKACLFTLFAGYEPHVKLQVEMMQDFGSSDQRLRFKYQVTVDQFKKALSEVETFWMSQIGF